jgi:hypothetical protein
MKALNGFYAARKTNDAVRTVFIDEETMELRELSRCIARNRAEKEKAVQAEADHQNAIRQQAAKEERRRRRALRRLVKQEVKLLASGGVVALGWYMGLVELAFAVPVLLIFQATIFFRAGKYMGRK